MSLKLRAGRKLDRRIGEKVFGYNQGFPCELLPRFSTSMTDAWLLVEHVQKRGYNVTIADDPGASSWWCRFGKDSGGFNRSGATPAEAICRAALFTLGGDMEAQP